MPPAPRSEWAEREAVLVSEMIVKSEQRAKSAVQYERHRAVAFCRRHPAMPAESVAAFLEAGEHRK